MAFKNDLKRLAMPYYWVNLLLTFSYILGKKIVPICELIFPDKTECGEIDMRESEILFFLLIVVVMRARKTGSMSMVSYLSSSFIYTKGANLILWFYSDTKLGIAYGAIFILVGLLLPEPTYKGPENVTYFRGTDLEEEIKRDKRITWIVTFYTAWNPSCVNFAPIFAELSNQYGLENLRFAKVDIGRFPEVAKRFRIDDSSLSRQLPTVILFKDAKEHIRRPDIDTSNKLHKFYFSEDNVKAAFDLNNIYNESKNNPLKSPKKSKKLQNGTEDDHIKSE
ncbi:thioredoxin-related transmembrane protein 2 homolog [Neocloeon triangulifer]|uniref:thioredoxin-related transmembrane protein 2 homolog n=1 Tax=Neocloeon triangulifer TaxID=2078957 RepID=UPI00286F7F6E|nr:thioredoxin-related transmembrane protein 2 homolog [Neocloeon triangulifer]